MINITYAMALVLLGLAGLVLFQMFGIVEKAKTRKLWTVISIVALGVGLLPALGWTDFGYGAINNKVGSSLTQQTLAIGSTGTDTGTTAPTTTSTGQVVSTYQPTATYTTTDKYAQTSTITGTSYYRKGTSRFATSALTNTQIGDKITYWVDNSSTGTYWTMPTSYVITDQVTPLNNLGYNNGSATLSLYDLVGKRNVNFAAATNISLGANAQANVEVSYQPTYKKSAMPFGGLMVVEYNSTISSVSCTGDSVLSTNPYHLTYNVGLTANTYRAFPIAGVQDGANAIDDGSSGKVKYIYCQFLNGATAAPTTLGFWNVTMIPANYYLAQDGQVYLDVEKYADSSTTRIGSTINKPTISSNWQ